MDRSALLCHRTDRVTPRPARREFEELPAELRALAAAFTAGLVEILGRDLHGVYMYGAAVFADCQGIVDFDAHVLLERPPDTKARAQIDALHARLGRDFPRFAEELDLYYLLRSDAERADLPAHLLRAELRDRAWPLHCAHVRAGYFLRLHGPAPTETFPEPSWPAVVEALDDELRFVARNLHTPAYCVLNLARILYSHLHRDPVLSKRHAGAWAARTHPSWAPLLEAALRSYAGTATSADAQRLHGEIGAFFAFARSALDKVLEPRPGAW
jgi:hypothetical protein